MCAWEAESTEDLFMICVAWQMQYPLVAGTLCSYYGVYPLTLNWKKDPPGSNPTVDPPGVIICQRLVALSGGNNEIHTALVQLGIRWRSSINMAWRRLSYATVALCVNYLLADVVKGMIPKIFYWPSSLSYGVSVRIPSAKVEIAGTQAVMRITGVYGKASTLSPTSTSKK